MRKILNEQENKYLVVKVDHSNGRYILYVRWEIQRVESGFMCIETVPFADGNFACCVGLGRKSQKKLQEVNGKIEENSDLLTVLWKSGDYDSIKAHVAMWMK